MYQSWSEMEAMAAVTAVSPLGSVSMRMSRRWPEKDAGCDAAFVAVSVVKLMFLSGNEGNGGDWSVILSGMAGVFAFARPRKPRERQRLAQLRSLPSSGQAG